MIKSAATWLPSLNALRAFEAVARHCSFQKAAEELSVTSAAVQQLVRGLEATLDTPLIVRKGRQLIVTERGQAGFEELQSGFENLGRAVENIRQHCDRQQLRISVEPAFARGWLIDRLPRFQEQFHGIDVLIESTNRLIDLKKGEADIALRYNTLVNDDLHYHRLFEDEVIAICNPSLLKGRATPLSPAALLEYPLIQYEWPRQLSTKVDWQDWVKQMGFDIVLPTSKLRFTDYNLAVQSTFAGMGIGLVSRPLVTDSINTGLLVEPFDEGVSSGCGYDILFVPENRDKPGLMEFTNWIIEEATP